MEKINLGLNEENSENQQNVDRTNNDTNTKKMEDISAKTINFNNLVSDNETTTSETSTIIDNPLRANPNSSMEDKEFFDNLDDFIFSSDVNIKIFGLGGAGNNMVNHIAETTNIDRKCLYAINTDFQFLKKLPANLNRILIGKTITKGMGSGSDPVIGSKAAIEDSDLIREKLEGTDLLFIVSGMGKGTGTGASPIVAKIAKEMNILTICVVNLPSITAEGKVIYEKGINGLNELRKYADGLSIISNEKIINNTFDSQEITLRDSFLLANDFIANIVNELTNLVNTPTEINIDFNDVKTFFKEQTVFHLNTFNLKSAEDIKSQIINEIRNVIYQDDIRNSSKAILNLKLNPKAPKNLISIIREALEEILKNSDFTLSYAVDYSQDIEFANISLLISSDKLLGKQYEDNEAKDFENVNSNELSKNFELKDLDLASSNNNTMSLRFVDSIDDKLTSELKTNSLRESNEEMRRFIDVNNINTDSISHLDNEQTKIEELTKENKFNLHDEDFSSFAKSIKDEFNDLKKSVTDTNFTSSRQEITITRQIKENSSRNINFNSTALNKFFTKTLRFPKNTSHQKNSKN